MTDPEPVDDLRKKVIQVVKEADDLTIRPAQLACELGISIDDACAELCGLLAAVGGGPDGASFRFVSAERAPSESGEPAVDEAGSASNTIMEFRFPSNFEARALRYRRKQDWVQFARSLTRAVWKVVKAITAFGLILSLFILCVLAIVGLMAAIVAISRGGNGDQHRGVLMRQVRSIFYTLRQILWLYALFGPDAGQSHPFLREVAHDLALVFSLCCGNPMSAFFWWRAMRLSQRQQRLRTGWGGRQVGSDVESVQLVRPGDWNDHTSGPDAGAASEEGEYRGLLSIVVEFMFGPTPFDPGPDEPQRWKIRAIYLLDKCLQSPDKSIPVMALAPFMDHPPSSLDDEQILLPEGLLIVACFNGKPMANNQELENAQAARFVFPELMRESSSLRRSTYSQKDADERWSNFFFADENITQRPTTSGVPSYLREERYRFTKLPRGELLQSVALGALNLLGVFWFDVAVQRGGQLDLGTSGWAMCIQKLLMPALRFYAILFFIIPGARLAVIVAFNSLRISRNAKRHHLAQLLSGL